MRFDAESPFWAKAKGQHGEKSGSLRVSLIILDEYSRVPAMSGKTEWQPQPIEAGSLGAVFQTRKTVTNHLKG